MQIELICWLVDCMCSHAPPGHSHSPWPLHPRVCRQRGTSLLSVHGIDDSISAHGRGHDVESARHNHYYTREERQRLNDVESIDYLPPNSAVYRRWVAQQPWG